MQNEPQHPGAAELAELYAGGGLTKPEQTHFEERLQAGDPAYVAAWEWVRSVAQGLLESAPEVAPPEQVWSRIEQALPSPTSPATSATSAAAPTGAPAFASLDPDAPPDPVADAPEKMVILRGPDVEWSETDVQGVQTRALYVDREHGRLTLLVRMAPGAAYTDHEHDGVEECMVIEGDLRIAGTVLRGGDYLRTPSGAKHGVPSTERGCLLLVTTPFTSNAA